MTDQDGQLKKLRDAYEELTRRVVAERLVFADRVQEEVEEAQRAVADRDPQIAHLTDDLQAVRTRVESLHEELLQAHAELKAVRSTRLFRLSAKLRRR